jgi:mRNA interferase RelE/StbE
LKYSIEFAREAESDLDAVHLADRSLFKRVLNKIEFLADHPLEGKPLVGNHKGEYSLRLGHYRIVYELDSQKHIVYILTIKHRKHAYR